MTKFSFQELYRIELERIDRLYYPMKYLIKDTKEYIAKLLK